MSNGSGFGLKVLQFVNFRVLAFRQVGSSSLGCGLKVEELASRVVQGLGARDHGFRVYSTGFARFSGQPLYGWALDIVECLGTQRSCNGCWLYLGIRFPKRFTLNPKPQKPKPQNPEKPHTLTPNPKPQNPKPESLG